MILAETAWDLLSVAVWLCIVQVPLVYVWMKWFLVWRRLPRASLDIRTDRRITVEGTIREAIETMEIPDRKDQICVAWACFFETDDNSPHWVSRSRPFVLELDGGHRIQVDLLPNRWHTNRIGLRPVDVAKTLNDDEASARRLVTWNRHFAEHVANAGREAGDFDHVGGADGDYSHYRRRIAVMQVGDRVTLSGVFLPTPGEVTRLGYRGVAALPSYLVQPVQDMPRPRPPVLPSLARQGQVRNRIPFPPVLLFHGRRRDGLVGNREVNREIRVIAIVMGAFLGGVEWCVWMLFVALAR